MPRRPRRPKRRKDCGLTNDQLAHLISGWTLDAVTPYYGKLGYPFQNDEDRKRLWFENKTYIFSLIGKKRVAPLCDFPWGTRPSAWWDYEALEERRLLEGYCEIMEGLSKGKPHIFSGCENGELPCYETQYEYLERLGLLLQGEREKVEELGDPEMCEGYHMT